MSCKTVRHFHVLQFHALHIGPSISCPAISCPAILMVCHFHVLHFQSTRVWSNPKPPTNVRQAHFKMNRAFKGIQGHPYWCRQESRTVCCRHVQLMPTLFLKLTKIWQRENGKFVDFNDPTQVWRRPRKKRLRISTNDLYSQKLELLTYIPAADSEGLHSLILT